MTDLLALNALVAILLFIVIAVLPGAAFFRMPILRRDLRAALPSEERWFWQIVTSLVWSVGVALALGALSAYAIVRVAGINLWLGVFVLIAFRGRLRMAAESRGLTAAVILPLILAGFALWRFLPADEYILGGKDPGVYVNEGISLARTGTIFRRDAIVADVPADQKELFFHDYPPTEYYGLRFMGVFLNDPATGEVIPGFPHLLPASIALGYGVGGLYGATSTTVFWAVLGLLAVYFFGARLAGRAPAFAATLLLALNVIEAWYGRFPNAEVVMQTFVFAGLLAFSYAVTDNNRYFSWVAGALGAALIFLRFDAYLAIAAIAGAAALVWIVERKSAGWPAGLLIAAATALAWWYYGGPMRAYFWQYRENLPAVGAGLALFGGALAVVLALGAMRGTVATPLRHTVPAILIVTVIGLAIYALFFRQPAGRLAAWDAYALRRFRDAYVFWPALIAGLVGFAMLAWKRFWKEPAFFLLMAAFVVFFFYKLRIQTEHFWIARRFLPVILPGLLLLASAGAFGVFDNKRGRPVWRAAAATIFLGFIGWQYAVAAAPVAAHVEYRGAIHQLQKLADRVGDRDLVIFENRESGGDVHVLALPLAYAFGKNVLLLDSWQPNRRKMEEFLKGAATRYDRVLFVANAGTDLLSSSIVGTPIVFTPVSLPEYATSGWDEYPAGPRQKDLGYCLYQLSIGQQERRGLTLDVGGLDDLHVRSMFARETTEGRSVRWTKRMSLVAVTGLAGTETTLTMVMHNGGRPAKAPAAAVEVFFNNVSLGTIAVGDGFREYRVTLPPDLVRAAAANPDPAELRLMSTTWKPIDYLGGTDNRDLGVMIDRIEIH
ncbi:MAG TPA: hypothetical protein VN700_17220 [Vicinamibacterales bacterium]|nr:hypothetical protein [Vicinamibacterales bacterium]